MYTKEQLQKLFNIINMIIVRVPKGSRGTSIKLPNFTATYLTDLKAGSAIALLTDKGNWYLVGEEASSENNSTKRIIEYRRTAPQQKTSTIIGLAAIVTKLNFGNVNGVESLVSAELDVGKFPDKYFTGVDYIFEFTPLITQGKLSGKKYKESKHYLYFDDINVETFYKNSSNIREYHNFDTYDKSEIIENVYQFYKAENLIFNRITYQSMGYIGNELNIFTGGIIAFLFNRGIANAVLIYRIKVKLPRKPTSEFYWLYTQSDMDVLVIDNENQTIKTSGFYLNKEEFTMLKYRSNGKIKYCGLYYLRYVRGSDEDVPIEIDDIKDKLIWGCFWGLGEISEVESKDRCSLQLKGSLGVEEGYERKQTIAIARAYGTDGGIVVVIKANPSIFFRSFPPDFLTDRNKARAFLIPDTYLNAYDEQRIDWRDFDALDINNLPPPLDTRNVIYGKIIPRPNVASTYLTYWTDPEKDKGKVVFT